MPNSKTPKAETKPPKPIDALDEMVGDPNFMMSLARGLVVLRAFSEAGPSQTLSQLSRLTGLARASVRRCLYTLEKLGYVTSDGRYFSPLPGLLSLADAYLSPKSFPVAAQPVLERLRDKLSESCSLGMLNDDDVIYVARAEKSRIMSVALHVGSRLPLYCTSMGRVLLASLSEAERDAYLARTTLSAKTQHTVTSVEELQRMLTVIAQQDYAVNDQELEIGLRSIAVPVRDRSGRVVAALNIGTHVAHAKLDELRRRFLPALQAAAKELSQLAR